MGWLLALVDLSHDNIDIMKVNEELKQTQWALCQQQDKTSPKHPTLTLIILLFKVKVSFIFLIIILASIYDQLLAYNQNFLECVMTKQHRALTVVGNVRSQEFSFKPKYWKNWKLWFITILNITVQYHQSQPNDGTTRSNLQTTRVIRILGAWTSGAAFNASRITNQAVWSTGPKVTGFFFFFTIIWFYVM